MNTLPITPLESWIGRKIGLPEGVGLSSDGLRRYQLDRFNDTLAHVRNHSPFYRDLLSGFQPKALTNLDQVSSLPFATVDDLRRDHARMLCVSLSDVARIVTLRTSGTTAEPKRLYFTDDDLELTADFFQHGMSTLVRPGWTVLVLLPGALPDSVGDLLVKGLARMFVKGIVHGPVSDPARAVDDIMDHEADCLVGIPSQVLYVARHRASRRIPPGRIKSVLLTTDYVPRTIVEELSRVWGCEVYEHYGMTEMGLGGGVQCSAHDGYHLREADMYVEIVDPDTGRPLPDGETGEVVFSTLTRRGMPLIRYRTGDIARFIPDPCPCGSVLKRLGKVQGRLGDGVPVGGCVRLTMPELDEAVFGVAGVLDYRAEVRAVQGRNRLCLTVFSDPEAAHLTVEEVKRVVERMVCFRGHESEGPVTVQPASIGDRDRVSTGTAKRTILTISPPLL